MRVLVTGATGFIGPHAVRALVAAGHEVISSSRGAQGPPGASLHARHDFAASTPFPAVGRIDGIVHLAADGNVQRAGANPASVARVNALGTLRALDVARQHSALFVLASTQRLYQPGPNPVREDVTPRPTEAYGYSKLAAELLAEMAGRVYGVAGARLRLFTVYGPGQVITSGNSGVVAIFGQAAVAGKPLVVMSHQRKDLVEVSDVVRGIVLALEHPSAPPRPYNIATGVPTSVLDLAQAIRSVIGRDCEIVGDYSEGHPGDLVANLERARNELGYQPRVTLKEGLHRYVEWLRAASSHPA